MKKIIDLVSLCLGGRKKMKKAFTLIELTVAVALLAMMISFASLIFDMSIDTYRTATASAEIMQKLQAITGQLNADFKGQRISPLSKISFAIEQSVIADNPQWVRSDLIVFFANGDFQSTEQCPYVKSDGGEGLKTVSGNVAGIFYGLADDTSTDDPREKILVRRQTILTSDSSLKQDFYLIDRQEYCNKQTLADVVADPCFVDDLMERPAWDPNNWGPDVLVTYMAKGVDDFTIQYVGEDNSGKPFNKWRPRDEDTNEDWLKEDISPRAFKFTFTLYDSKGVLEEGKTFTHIVYLGD